MAFEKSKDKGAGLALLIKMGKKKPSDDGSGDAPADTDSSPDMMGSGSDEKFGSPEDKMGGSDGSERADMAVSDLADTMGLPDESKDAFMSAFKNAIRACKDSY